MNASEGILKAIKAAEGNRHRYYKHTVEYGALCKRLVTAEDIEPLLKKHRRETDEEYKQRVGLTKLTTRSVLHRIYRPFAKALRNDEQKLTIEPNEAAEVLEDFYEDQSVKRWLDEHYAKVLFTDPNAWLLIDFEPFDPNTESADPYPLLLMSDSVLDFGQDYKGLHYITASIDDAIATFTDNYASILVKLPKDSAEAKGAMKLEDWMKSYRLEVAQSENLDDFRPMEGTAVKIADCAYRIQYAAHRAGAVPAFRLGYESDAQTDGQTMAAPYHACITRLQGAIKAMSERDLTVSLHAFPQKFIRTIECTGYAEGGEHYACASGFVNVDGEMHKCRNCNGTGEVPIHTTAQDVIAVPLGETTEDNLPLDEMVKYLTPDLDTARFLTEFIRDTEDACFHDVFPGNAYSIKMREMTATEARNNYDAIYDTLYPFTQRYSEVFEFAVKTVCTYTDTNLQLVSHSFPSDLKLKTMGDLMEEYLQAKNSDAPPSIRKAIERQMIQKQYIDSPMQRKKYLRRMDFDPLAGYTDNTLMLASMDISDRDRWIHYNIERIWMELEMENEAIYEMERSAALALFNAKVDELNPKAPVIAIDGAGEVNEEQANKLRETVGGVTGIIEMNRAVQRGEMTEQAAEAMLVELFGFSEDVARSLIEPGRQQPPTE